MSAADLRREARLAAAKERRAGWADRPVEAPYGPEVDITLEGIRVGDFVVVLPTQDRVRGVRCESRVVSVEHSWDTWKLGRSWVPSVAVTVAAGGRFSAPASFTVKVRRPLAAEVAS